MHKRGIIDLFVDARRTSPTYKTINVVRLSVEKDNHCLYQSLHGFLTLVDNTEVIYATDNYYEPQSEVSVSPYSDELSLYWGENPIYMCSDKDKQAQSLNEFFNSNK